MRVIEINSGNFGSTGNIMLQIAEAARTKGHTVITCCPKSRSNQKKKVGNQLFIGNRLTRNLHLRLTYLTGFNGCFSFVSTLRYLRKVSKFSPDVIHLHNLHNCYINLPLLFRFIKKNKIPVVWTLHDCWAFTGQCPHFTMVKCEKWKKGCGDCQSYHEYPGSLVDRTKIMWSLKKKWFTGVENLTIVTPSQWLADLVKQSYLSDYPVKVIYNGIDFDEYNMDYHMDTRELLEIPEDAFVVGMVGRLAEQKAPDVFVKVAKRIKEIIPKAFFLIVGDGPDWDEVQQEVDDNELTDSFILAGWTRRPMEYIKILDIAVLISRWEGFGLVLPEYMLANKPIVATDVDAIPFIVQDHVNGLLAPVDDDEKIAENVIEIYQDENLKKKLVSEGKREVAERFDVKRVAKEHERLFER